MDNKLICPVKRLSKNKLDLNVSLDDDNMNIKVDLSTKNIVKLVTEFINKKLKEEKNNG